jgi:hypothetical protein
VFYSSFDVTPIDEHRAIKPNTAFLKGLADWKHQKRPDLGEVHPNYKLMGYWPFSFWKGNGSEAIYSKVFRDALISEKGLYNSR